MHNNNNSFSFVGRFGASDGVRGSGRRGSGVERGGSALGETEDSHSQISFLYNKDDISECSIIATSPSLYFFVLFNLSLFLIFNFLPHNTYYFLQPTRRSV